MSDLEPREEIVIEASEFEHKGYKCPKCSRYLKDKKGQRSFDPDNPDMWEFRIRCKCGDIVVVIND